MRRDALTAVGAFVVGLCLIVAGAVYERREGIPLWVLVIPLALVCVGVAIRRRAPLAALAVGTVGIVADLVYSGPSLPTVLIYTDNLYAAALYGPAKLSRWLLGVTTVLAIATAAAIGFVGGDWRRIFLIGVQTGLVLVTPVSTAIILRQQRDQAAAERARAEQVARLAELDRDAAITAERARMARELHDMIANHFSAIAIQSTAVLSRKDLDAEAVRRIMESVRENSVQGMAEMRTMIGLLRAEGAESDAVAESTRPRLADAKVLVERSSRAGLESRITIEGEPRTLPISVDLAGYRIVQEALTNALKHGTAPVEVMVGYEPHHVRLTVDNPVNGRRAGLPGSGAGLIGMRERANLVGGAFEAGPYENGWRVRATLPTREEAS